MYSGNSKDCAQTGCIYKITCETCQESLETEKSKGSRQPGGQKGPNYVGMTMSSFHSRMKDHLKGQRSKSQSILLYRHDTDAHQGQPQAYCTRILGREQRVLPLSILEGLFIEAQIPRKILMRIMKEEEEGLSGWWLLEALHDKNS